MYDNGRRTQVTPATAGSRSVPLAPNSSCRPHSEIHRTRKSHQPSLQRMPSHELLYVINTCGCIQTGSKLCTDGILVQKYKNTGIDASRKFHRKSSQKDGKQQAHLTCRAFRSSSVLLNSLTRSRVSVRMVFTRVSISRCSLTFRHSSSGRS